MVFPPAPNFVPLKKRQYTYIELMAIDTSINRNANSMNGKKRIG